MKIGVVQSGSLAGPMEKSMTTRSGNGCGRKTWPTGLGRRMSWSGWISRSFVTLTGERLILTRS